MLNAVKKENSMQRNNRLVRTSSEFTTFPFSFVTFISIEAFLSLLINGKSISALLKVAMAARAAI